MTLQELVRRSIQDVKTGAHGALSSPQIIDLQFSVPTSGADSGNEVRVAPTSNYQAMLTFSVKV
jgi:hypothetical protein